MADPTSIKPLGVRTPPGQQDAREQYHEQTMRQMGKPKTVVSIQKMDTYVIQFFDAKGEAHTALLHHTGDQLLMHKADEAWAKDLRTVMPWVEEQAKKLVPAFAANDIKADTGVDIMEEDDGGN